MNLFGTFITILTDGMECRNLTTSIKKVFKHFRVNVAKVTCGPFYIIRRLFLHDKKKQLTKKTDSKITAPWTFVDRTLPENNYISSRIPAARYRYSSSLGSRRRGCLPIRKLSGQRTASTNQSLHSGRLHGIEEKRNK